MSKKYEYPALLVKVVDGDTIDVLLDLGFHFFAERRLRLDGVNAPELSGETKKEGLRAKRFVQRKLGPPGVQTLVVTSVQESDKYGRVVARVRLENGSDLSELLLENGMAEAYSGGARPVSKSKKPKPSSRGLVHLLSELFVKPLVKSLRNKSR